MIKPYYETPLGKLYHGDCLEIMPQLEPVDLVLTDPPYGVTKNNWDILESTKAAFDMLIPCNLVFTCQNPASAELIIRYFKYFKWSDVWYKSQSTGFLNSKVMPLRQHEDILIFSKGRMVYNPQITKKNPANIRPHGDCSPVNQTYGHFNAKRTRTIDICESYPRSVFYCENSQNGYHSNEKPLKLMIYLILTYSDNTHLILDPFFGSGTTAIACERLKRRWIGIEIEEKYCEISAKRIEAERKQLKLF